jgi:hypothetical protein
VVELVDTIGLEPVDFKKSCGFESHLSKKKHYYCKILLVQWKNFGLLSRLCRFESYRELWCLFIILVSFSGRTGALQVPNVGSIPAISKSFFRIVGLEPTPPAPKAGILPLNYIIDLLLRRGVV